MEVFCIIKLEPKHALQVNKHAKQACATGKNYKKAV